MKHYAIYWMMNENHMIIDMVRADSPEEAVKKAKDYKDNPPKGEIEIKELDY